MIAAVRSHLDRSADGTDEDDEDGSPTDEGDEDGDEEAPTIYGEAVDLDTVVVTVGRASVYHYPDEDGSPVCRPDREAVESTRRRLEPHYRPCRDCFDAPRAGDK